MIQTRSEINGIAHHKTIELALDAARKDTTIWKISFDTKDGFRVRLVSYTQKNNEWIFEPIIIGSNKSDFDPPNYLEDPRD